MVGEWSRTFGELYLYLGELYLGELYLGELYLGELYLGELYLVAVLSPISTLGFHGSDADQPDDGVHRIGALQDLHRLF